jgi:hypothetical protein
LYLDIIKNDTDEKFDVEYNRMRKIVHKGFQHFSKGTFGSGGDNLFVDANGSIRRITDNDLNGDGIFDIVFPNSHGYVERAPTYIYSKKNGEWNKRQLPHDSGWTPKAVDVDGDGFLDLIIVNGENGVTSELRSYIYWGGPNGLTGEYTAFDTIGAYDVAVCDINRDGLRDIIWSTAWYDHHNPGVPLNQKVFVQISPRKFIDATEEYKFSGLAVTSLICEDLNGDGFPELVLANFRQAYNYDTDSFIYWGGRDGFEKCNLQRLPTHYAAQVIAADLNSDGFKELIFCGGNQLMIYWNRKGQFNADDRITIEIPGMCGQFMTGLLTVDVADIDLDGIMEIVVGTNEGVEIRKTTDLLNVWKKLPCYGCSCVKAVDIMNSGRPDIIASYYCSQKSYDTKSLVFWNSEDGYSLENVTAFETHGVMGCMAADFDNDGIKEIVFCNTMMGPAQNDPEFPVFVYYGTSDHKYTAQNRRDYPVRFGCHTYVVADLDNDGFVELAATSMDGVRIFKGTPSGPDQSNYYDLEYPPGRLVGGVLVGDFNRDGWLDLIVVPWVYGNFKSELEESVFVYFGGPEGYSNKNRMVLPSYIKCAQSILLADINNDGYVDFLYGDGEGFIGVYYGGPDGFDIHRFSKIHLKDYNGALIMGLSAADVDKDGWLELFVTTGGHYTRRASHLYVLKGAKDNFPIDKTFVFETGGTTGYPALADMRKSGNLDLLLPFYSTAETRELPARIFYGDGKGNFDWNNPLEIDCLSSIAFCPVDISGNGYPDLFICCHRNNVGHIVDSKLIMNGPNGLDFNNVQNILGYGPHNFTAKNQGNALDRSDIEYYTSPVFECGKPVSIGWHDKTPFKTSLSFRFRFGESKKEVLESTWSVAIKQSNTKLEAPDYTKYMQYQVAFYAPGLVNSPLLSSVVINCE